MTISTCSWSHLLLILGGIYEMFLTQELKCKVAYTEAKQQPTTGFVHWIIHVIIILYPLTYTYIIWCIHTILTLTIHNPSISLPQMSHVEGCSMSVTTWVRVRLEKCLLIWLRAVMMFPLLFNTKWSPCTMVWTWIVYNTLDFSKNCLTVSFFICNHNIVWNIMF